jgi:hypothetical protein
MAKKPAYVRAEEDPVAYVALRKTRLPRIDIARFGEMLRIRERRLGACLPIVRDVLGLEVLRKYLWRALRGTRIADEIEAHGVAKMIPARTSLLTYSELLMFDSDAEPRVAGRIHYVAEIDRVLDVAPDRRHLAHDLRLLRSAMLKAPDAAMLEWPRWRREALAGRQTSSPRATPCGDPWKDIYRTVLEAAERASWRHTAWGSAPLPIEPHDLIARTLAFAGVTGITGAEVEEAIRTRHDDLRSRMKAGEAIQLPSGYSVAPTQQYILRELFESARK